MSRSGYDVCICNFNEVNLYRGNVDRALAGKRGQAFLKEMLRAMDAMPEKRLISHAMEVTEPYPKNDERVGDVCALGSVAKARGIDMSRIDALIESGDDDEVGRIVAKRFSIAEPMAREIMDANDDELGLETPEQRFVRMRAWIQKQIREAAE